VTVDNSDEPIGECRVVCLSGQLTGHSNRSSLISIRAAAATMWHHRDDRSMSSC